MDYEKAIKNAKWFAVGILVLAIIAFCLRAFGGTLNTLSIIIGIAQLIVIIATIKGLNDNQIYGSICGIIVYVLLMLKIINYKIWKEIFNYGNSIINIRNNITYYDVFSNSC